MLDVNEEFDFSVMPASDGAAFRKIFSSIVGGMPAAKWNEIRARREMAPESVILVDAALELSLTSQRSLFRKTDSANESLVAIWMAGVIKSARMKYFNENIKLFSGIRIEDIRKIALMSVNVESILLIEDYLLREFGIILVIDKAFSGMKLDGVATKLESGNPVIGLSLRFARYNNFWFTLLHELAHVALHYDLLADPIYDDFLDGNNSDVEKEANRVAADAVIPRFIFNKARVYRTARPDDLFELAEAAGVHPILAAGSVQHHLKNYKLFSTTVNSVDVRKMLGAAE